MTSKKVARIAKSVVNSHSETKFSIENKGYTTALHDTLDTGALLQSINQGTTQTSRIGDSIQLRGFKIKFVGFSTAATSKPATCRLMLLRVKKDTAPTSAQVFQSGTTWQINRHLNTDYCTVLLDKMITLRNSAVNTHPEVHTRSYWIPIKAKHVFESDDSDLGKYYNYYVAFTSFVENGTVATTNTCTYGMDVKTYYKDS